MTESPLDQRIDLEILHNLAGDALANRVIGYLRRYMGKRPHAPYYRVNQSRYPEAEVETPEYSPTNRDLLELWKYGTSRDAKRRGKRVVEVVEKYLELKENNLDSEVDFVQLGRLARGESVIRNLDNLISEITPAITNGELLHVYADSLDIKIVPEFERYLKPAGEEERAAFIMREIREFKGFLSGGLGDKSGKLLEDYFSSIGMREYLENIWDELRPNCGSKQRFFERKESQPLDNLGND